MNNTDLIIVGGGPAGMCAAVEAYKSGCTDILILERDEQLGGILQQCIHNGFGLHRFGEELTGPEYAWRCEKEIRSLPIKVRCGTIVTNIAKDKCITAISRENGVEKFQAKAVILAMGCREKPRGALNIPGTRPAGIFSAGTAQKYVNMMGYMPGNNVVILGSGDIGLIMARRMVLEGANVHAVCEVMPYSGGLERNLQQCLRDFNIPLLLSHTVTKIHGTDRIVGVSVSEVDSRMKPIKGTEKYIKCDTLLLSVGLIPENELTKQSGISLDPLTNGAYVDQNRCTEIDGIFACGNVLQVHDLADFVSEEAEIAGRNAAKYISKGFDCNCNIAVVPDKNIRYTVPQRITDCTDDIKIFFRSLNVYKNAKITVTDGTKTLFSRKKPRIAPGEMQCITLKASNISKDFSKIYLSILAGEE